MRRKGLVPVAVIATTLFLSGNLLAQNCVPTGLNHSVVTSFCYQACRNVTFQVPDLRSTSSYTIVSIPYTPYEYVTPGGTFDGLLYQDDAYSNVFDLPFPFCFYDQVFYKAVICSNGFVTFDYERKLQCPNAFQAPYRVTNPLFYTGGTGAGNCGSNNYPVNTIMGVFMDLDPSIQTGVYRNRKVEWRVEGQDPCRRFVVSFSDIAAYGNTSCGTNNGPTTFQMIMTESTGVIEVFIKNKQCNSILSSNPDAANAILGIQGTSSSQFAAAPGKNRAEWTASMEGYRFVPTGGASRFVSAELLNLDHSPFAGATVANTTAGLLDLNFTNVCTPSATTDYVLRTRFSSCSDPTVFLEAYDTISFTRSKMTATHSSTASSCAGAADGTITVTLQNGQAPYSYSIDGGPAVSVPASPFTIPGVTPGTHTVVAYGAAPCETDPISVIVTSGSTFSTTATSTDVLCNGAATGSITVTQPTSGVAPYQYSLDGVTWQSSNVFNGLPAGSYTVRFRESSGCQGQLTVIVNQPLVFGAIAAATPVKCNGQNDGIITVTPINGSGTGFQYSADGVNWQGSPVFNVPAGSYTITVRDGNACIATATAIVTEPPALTATATTTNASCDGGPDGSITITATGGNGNYTYSLNNGPYQTSNTFNVVAGSYSITARDNLGCTITLTNQIVGLINNLTFTAPATPTICEGTSTQLQVNSNALQYAWSPATGLSSATISNPVASPVTTTTYTVTLTLGGCSIDVPVTVNVNPAPIPDAGAPGFICFGQNYQLQASGGTRFQWTPATFLDSDTIFNPLSIPDKTTTYTLSVIDANGCHSLVTDEVTVDVTPPITVYTFPYDTVVYEGDQFQILATSIATDYLWSPGIGLSDATIPNPMVTAGAAGDVTTYQVTASTIAGCKGIGYVRVQVYKGPDIYMPTGFTPNNDGKNDLFRPFTVGITKLNYFKVFNRWGQELYSTTTLGAGWDGRLGGVQQASGVYVWMVEGVTRDNRVIRKKGTVALIR